VDHKRRISIADAIASKLLKRYKNEILYIGISGSTGSGEDLRYSDLDLVVISKSLEKEEYYWLIDGISIGIEFFPLWRVKKIFNEINDEWPLRVGEILGSKPVYDKNNTIGKLGEEIHSIPDSTFNRAVAGPLFMARGGINKVKNSFEIKNLPKMKEASSRLILATNRLIALTNRSYFNREGIAELKKVSEFAKLPDNYVILCDKILSSNNIEELYQFCLELYGSCEKFAEKNNVRLRHWSADKIEV
jgi:hypothetical protein